MTALAVRSSGGVAIAGTGIAASALACCLIDEGFDVVLLGRPPASRLPIVEALPAATVRLAVGVGLRDALDEAGAVTTDGFENHDLVPGRTLSGTWTYVDRTRLARASLLAARRRGARLLPARQLRPPTRNDDGTMVVLVDGRPLRVLAAVDATGRGSRWSRPVGHGERTVATLYHRSPGPGRARPGRIVRTGDGWAYRLDHPDTTTIGTIADRPGPPVLPADIGDRLDAGTGFVRVAARPAGVQWAATCVEPGRISVGDAALAYSPRSGQGLRFALASARAATAVITTWRDGDAAIANEYYEEFVDAARARHLAKITAADQPVEESPVRIAPHAIVEFRAPLRPAALNVGGRIERGTVCVLPDGASVRWVGGFDVLTIRDLSADRPTVVAFTARLVDTGMGSQAATSLSEWLVRRGVLATAGGQGGGFSSSP